MVVTAGIRDRYGRSHESETVSEWDMLVLHNLRPCHGLRFASHLVGRRFWCRLVHCHHLGEEKPCSWTVRAKREVDSWPNLGVTVTHYQRVALCATGVIGAKQANLFNSRIDCTEGKATPSPPCQITVLDNIGLLG